MSASEPARPHRYAVYGPGTDEPLVIDAENWVFALGTALELLEREDWVSRLACEVHPDGTVLAEDRVTSARYLVHRIPPGSGGKVEAGKNGLAMASSTDGADNQSQPAY